FRSVINAGEIQWMTAGRGIVQSENMPAEMREKGGELEIIQLWMNLPKRLKMTPPAYQGFQREDIPVVDSVDGLVKTQVISGSHLAVKGVANSLTHLTVLNVAAQKGGKESFEINENQQILFYVLRGEVLVNGKLAIDHQIIDFKSGGNSIEIEAQEDTRFVLASGEPINEPVVAQGP